MKEGVFQETAEILEDYVVHENFVLPEPSPPVKKQQAVKVKIRMESREEQRPSVQIPFQLKRPESDEEQDESEFETLLDYCRRNSSSLVYKKFANEGFNRVHSEQYAASLFMYVERGRVSKQHGQRINSLEQLLTNTLRLVCLRPDGQNRLISFDSNFQSGNLLAAYKVAHNEYDLVLHNDINSKGNLQWFYFSVNVEYPMELRFNIINLLKYDSLFNYGMQICVFSEKRHRKTGEGWIRAGKKIVYERSDLLVENQSKRSYYSLSFTYDFKSEDRVYFAHSFPYTYSRLNDMLLGIISNPIKAKTCRREIIGTTLMNLNVQCLTLSEERLPAQDNRKAIVLMARQHPGETVSSWVMEGFIDQMLKRSRETDYLRKNFVVKVIPMINPDGVVIGNYRSNLSGCDLNRNWNTDKKSMYPQVFAVRSYLAELARERRIKIVIDLHGHSKKMQTFYYGNGHSSPQLPRLFPFIASKLSSEVNYEECTFSNSDDRRNTARMALAALMNTPTVYTYECTFFGGVTYRLTKVEKAAKKYAYGIEDYKRLGSQLTTALYEYCNEESEVHKKLAKELSSNLNLLNSGSKSSCSQSNPEQCELKEEQREEVKLVCASDRFASLPSQRNIRSMSLRRDRNTSRCAKVEAASNFAGTIRTANPHTEAMLHRKQLQRMLEFRQTMEIFEKRIICSRIEKRPDTFDKETQTDPNMEIPQVSGQQPLRRSRVIKATGSKLVFTIEVKKDSHKKQIGIVQGARQATQSHKGKKQASRNFANRATQTTTLPPSSHPRRSSILICELPIERSISRKPRPRSRIGPLTAHTLH